MRYIMRYVLALFLFLSAVAADAAILVFSPNGTYVSKGTLSEAATASDTAGKTVVVTSALSAAMSNISSATLHAWPTDRALEFRKGASVGNTTHMDFTGATVTIPKNTLVFTGVGQIVGLPEVWPEMFADNVVPGTTDMTVATQKCLDTKSLVKLGPTIYKWTDTLYFYEGSHLEGANKRPGWQGASAAGRTKIVFAPSSEKNLFNLYDNTTESYIYRVYIGGMDIIGNTTGGGTYSKYAIYGRQANSVFENLLLEKFQVGIYNQYTMLNHFSKITIFDMTDAGLKTGDDDNTSNIFDGVYFGYSVWGAILKNALDYRFINCTWESLSTGGVRIYKGFGTADFMSNYAEDVPNTSGGINYGMFYVAHDVPVANNGTAVAILGGKYHGSNGTAYGSFLDVDSISTVSGVADRVTVVGVNYGRFVNGIKVDGTNTKSNSVYVAGNSVRSLSYPIIGDDTPDIVTNGYRVFGVQDTTSGGITSSAVKATTLTGGSLTIDDPLYGALSQTVRYQSFTNGSSQEINFTSAHPGLIQISVSDGVSVHESAIFAVGYVTGTNTCVVTKLSGSTNTAATNTGGSLCIYPTGAGAGSVTVVNNLGVTVQASILITK